MTLYVPKSRWSEYYAHGHLYPDCYCLRRSGARKAEERYQGCIAILLKNLCRACVRRSESAKPKKPTPRRERTPVSSSRAAGGGAQHPVAGTNLVRRESQERSACRSLYGTPLLCRGLRSSSSELRRGTHSINRLAGL